VGDITLTGTSLLEAGAVQTKGGKQKDAHTREVRECNGPRQSLGFQITKSGLETQIRDKERKNERKQET